MNVNINVEIPVMVIVVATAVVLTSTAVVARYGIKFVSAKVRETKKIGEKNTSSNRASSNRFIIAGYYPAIIKFFILTN